MSGTSGQNQINGNSLSQFQCPILKPTNYTVWAIRIKTILEANGLWETIEPAENATVDTKKDKSAIAYLFQAIPEDVVLQVASCKTAKEIWENLRIRHVGVDRVQKARMHTLMSEFEMLQMKDDDTIDSFTAKINSIVTRATEVGSTMSQPTLVRKLLNGVPDRFTQIVASMEQYSDIETMTLQEAVGRLKTYEERLKLKKGSQGESQDRLMFTHQDNNRGRQFGNRGRGRFNQTRGNWQNNGNRQSPRNEGSTSRPRNGNSRNWRKFARTDLSKVQCFKCQKFGHYRKDCSEKDEVQEHSNLVEEDEAPVLLMTIQEENVQERALLNEEQIKPASYASGNENLWYLDNGASNHMTGVRSHFKELDETVTGQVRFGDGSHVEIKGKGSILLECMNQEQKIVSQVYYIPSLKTNILSLGQLTETGCKVVMDGDLLTIRDRNRKLLMRVKRLKNRLYKVKLKTGKPICLLSKTEDIAWLWHARLGHLHFDAIKEMTRKNLVHGVPQISHASQVCDACLLGKHSRAPFPNQAKFRSLKPLDLVYGDLCGPITPPTHAGKKYIFLLVDDCTRYMWAYLLTSKDQAFETFKEFKEKVEKEAQTKLKMLRTDRGGEFTSAEFNKYCKTNGIARQLTAPYSPQQNGVVERRNRTMLSTTRSMLKAMNMPQNFWGEAVRHAIYVLNRVPTKALVNKTPFEALKGRKPNLEHLKVFGCTAYAKVLPLQQKKLDDRSTPMVYLGIEEGSKAYRLYDPAKNKICVSRDVKFMEGQPWNWDSYMETVDSGNPEWTNFVIHEDDIPPELEENEPSSPGSSGPGSSGPHHDDSGVDQTEEQDSYVTPPAYSYNQNSAGNSSNIQNGGPSTSESTTGNISNTPVRLRSLEELYDETEEIQLDPHELLLAEEEPRNYKEASSDRKWIEAMKAELDSINKNNTWSLTELPRDHKAIGLKWVFKTKKDANGNIVRHKARLVAKGYVQQHGIDFDEVFAPVARMETVRLMLALAAYQGWEVHHLDVKSAFLHGDLKEEVYVSQPEGFIKPGDEGKVYRLSKALYGLRQAPRAWNTKLDQTLKSLNFKKCTLESAIYTRTNEASTLIVGVYVDDLIVTGTSKKEIDIFKSQMKNKFDMSDLGLLAYYLGIEVIQAGGEIGIKQT
ncbi:putative RNA-directed DNA polymerase [Helianthus annuus]|nr:putative RNA-directed DNA polymerase [Helianthus annuus]